MDVVIHSILCRFFRRLEQRSYVDVPAHIGKGCRENLLASVVSVLPHLSQEIRGRRPSNASNLSASFFASSSFAEPSNSLEYTPEIVWMVALKRPDTFQPHRKFHRGTHGHEPPALRVQAGYRFTAFCRFGDCFQIAGNSLRITDASQFSRRLICALRTAVLSMDSTFSGSSFARRYLFKPTMVSLPLSISA